MAIKETLGMWWAKILIPIAFGIISALSVYFYEHEIRTDQIETDLILLKNRTEDNRTETKEYLLVLKDIAKGTQANRESMIKLESKTNAIIDRNNQMIEALINEAKGRSIP